MTNERVQAAIWSLALGVLAACGAGAEKPAPEPQPAPVAEKSNLIRVTWPAPNAVIESPLILTGEARGTWYFEASFPVSLLDGNGTKLVQTHAQAMGEWMTEDFVPFRSELAFTPPATSTGTLVLEKDNPSGLPEHRDELRVPVRFAPP